MSDDRGVYLIAYTPDRISSQGLYSTVGSVNGVILNAEDEEHFGVNRLDVNTVANSTEDTCSGFGRLDDFSKVVSVKLPDGMVRVCFDHDRKLDLTFEFIELSSVLGLGKGKIVPRDVFDGETMLLKDVLGFSGIMKVVIAQMDTTGVNGNAVGEASVLPR